MSEKTPWFSAKKYKPVRDGEYEVCALGYSYEDNMVRLCYVNGVWRTSNGNMLNPPFGSVKGDAWRGLTKESK